MKKKTIIKRTIQIVIIVCALGWMLLMNYTPVFLKSRTASEGYLSYPEYILVDQSGRQVSSVNGLSFPEAYTSEYDSSLQTSRGLKPGDSWDRFAELYGDCMANSISAYEPDTPTEKMDSAYTDLHYQTLMRVADFDRDYIQSGVLPADKNEISVTFLAATRGSRILYTQNELNNDWDDEYDRTIWIGSWDIAYGLAKRHSVTLTVFAEPDDSGRLVITHIMSSTY